MSLWTWIGGIFHSIKVKIAPAIVGILEVIKGAEDSGVVDAIAKVIDQTFHTTAAENGNAILKKAVISGIAVFLAIEDLPDNATEAQVQTFGQNLLTALAGKKATQSIAGQVNVNLGAQIYTIIDKIYQGHKVDGGKVTVQEITIAVEEAWQDYQKDLAAAQANKGDATT
jgi:hypothetical protein